MLKNPVKISGWLFLTISFFLILVCFPSWMTHYYSNKEKLMHPPALPKGIPVLEIRNDSMGKGHYGARRSRGRKHTGIDILANMKDPVFAVKSGRIIFSEPNRGYGNLVSIMHPDDSVTRYAHLDSIDAFKGEWVCAGDVIGRIGKSGNADHDSILPHLHFELRRDNKPIDPTGLFQPV